MRMRHWDDNTGNIIRDLTEKFNDEDNFLEIFLKLSSIQLFYQLLYKILE